MGDYRYRIVDVFTDQKLEGNPLAVFPEAQGLDARTMQKIAQEFNLAETAFVLPPTRPGCLAQVKIFTPTREMVFAGHPTIGTAWVLRDEGRVAAGVEEFLLDELVGPVPVRAAGTQLWLRTPPISWGPSFDAAACAATAGLDSSDLLPVTPQLLSAGNPNIYVAVRDQEAVDHAQVDGGRLRQLRAGLDPVCFFVFTPTATGAYSRMFAPEHGVVEDPATGSATGPLAAFMMRHGLAPTAAGTRLVSEQGVKMGRRSLLHILIHGEAGSGGIDVGGNVVPLMAGVLTL